MAASLGARILRGIRVFLSQAALTKDFIKLFLASQGDLSTLLQSM